MEYNNVDWFISEVTKLENKMTFFFENTNKDINTTQKDEDFEKNNLPTLWKKIISDNVWDHCLLTGNYRGPAHSKCIVNVTQKQSNFIPFFP